MTDSARHSSALLARVADELVRLAPRLEQLSRELHRDPELGTREFHAVARLAGELEEEGFEVGVGTCGLPTAFRAERSSGAGGSIALLAEYDAIPALGHAAGHNLLSVASVGAAVAVSRLLGEVAGRIVVLGAPAEETIGGKVVLAERGALAGIDAALLAHPAQEDRVEVATLASWSVEVVFEGRAAHAVAAPERGINALDAMIGLFGARDALVRGFEPGVHLPGVILEGGVRPNLIPDRARARFSMRAQTASYLADVVAVRFRAAAEEIARATRTQLSWQPIDNLYDEFLSNPELARLFREQAQACGFDPLTGAGAVIGSLDTGRLSHLVPALHPLYRIGDGSVASHTAEFTALAIGREAFGQTLRAATALARTAALLLIDPELRGRVAAAHPASATRFSHHGVPLVTRQAEG